jgi:tRNA (guanine37-N1)-methyltransferase
MKISILTLFPGMFSGPFTESILKNAQAKNLVTINLVDIRDFGLGAHQMVDDTPYGGGIGMVMKVDVVKAAIDSVKDNSLEANRQKVVLMTADGKTYSQRVAEGFAKLEHLILVCGHYEGIDERIRNFVDEEISIGDFVLTGGEIPSMIITDSVIRLIDGVLKPGVTSAESFSHQENNSYLLEYPLYTKPVTFEGLEVPEILLSGDHKKIEDWRRNESIKKTTSRRPDLLKKD